MNMIALGVDIVEIAEILRLADAPGGHFLANFTPAELADAGHGVKRAERLAGRYAAKEAVIKALGTGWGNGIAWTDIEVRTATSGAPSIILQNEAARIAEGLGITGWLVSTSHDGGYAIANAIGLSVVK